MILCFYIFFVSAWFAVKLERYLNILFLHPSPSAPKFSPFSILWDSISNTLLLIWKCSFYSLKLCFFLGFIYKWSFLWLKVAVADMRYFSRSKFSRSLVHKKNYSLLWQVVFKFIYLFIYTLFKVDLRITLQ